MPEIAGQVARGSPGVHKLEPLASGEDLGTGRQTLRICRRGYPSSPNPDYAAITPWGQFIGAMIMFWGLGFIPAYILGWVCKKAGILRVPQEIELAGLDVGEIQSHYGLGDEVRAAEEEIARSIRPY